MTIETTIDKTTVSVINTLPDNTFQELIIDTTTGEVIGEGWGDVCDLTQGE